MFTPYKDKKYLNIPNLLTFINFKESQSLKEVNLICFFF